MRPNRALNKVIAVAALALAAWPPSPRAEGAETPQHETNRQLAWSSFIREGEDFERFRLSDRDVIRVRHEGGTVGGVALKRRPAFRPTKSSSSSSRPGT